MYFRGVNVFLHMGMWYKQAALCTKYSTMWCIGMLSYIIYFMITGPYDLLLENRCYIEKEIWIIVETKKGIVNIQHLLIKKITEFYFAFCVCVFYSTLNRALMGGLISAMFNPSSYFASLALVCLLFSVFDQLIYMFCDFHFHCSSKLFDRG